MKKIIFLPLVFSLLFCSCTSTNEQDDQQRRDNKPTDFAPFSKNLNEYFEALKSLEKFNGGVLVQKDGHQLLYEVYNMEQSEGNTLAVTKSSQFDIHSISKLMAQAGVVDLAREHLIDRNEKISKYIPDFPKGDLITIQHLIDNQSGLPRGFSKDYPDLIEKSPAEIVEYIKEETLLFTPGTETMYSNLGYQLLYFIISKIEKKPFVQFLEDTFFQPLQMTNTGAHFHLSKNNLTHLVQNHENDDDQVTVVPNIEKDGKNQAKIYSTLEDLLKFINHIKEEPYQSQMINKAQEVGWSGGGDGILSHAKASIKSNYEIVFFSNYDEIPFGDILATVEKIMTNQPYDLPEKISRKAVKVDPALLKKYEGKYRVKEFNNNIFEFRMEDEALVFYQDGERNSLLSAESDSTFFDQPDAEDYFEFRKSKEESYELIYHYKKIEMKGERSGL